MSARRTSSRKSSGRQARSHFDNLCGPLYEEALDLFGHHQDQDIYDSELELPIKIETRPPPPPRPRKLSDSYSESHHDLFREEKPFVQESEEHPTPARDYDPIDELLLPIEQFDPSAVQQPPAPPKPEPAQQAAIKQQQMMQEKLRLEEAPVPELKGNEVQAFESDSASMAAQKRSLLLVINNFQAYKHSLKVAMNFHVLMRKDAATKMFGSLLGVIQREGNKMEHALLAEIKTLSARTPTPPHEEELVTTKKDLEKTMASEPDLLVKQEYIE